MIDKAVYLTVYEFYILLTRGNPHGLVMFEEIQGYIPDREEIAQGVLSLLEKNYLETVDNDAFCLTKDVQTVLDIMDKAKSTFVISGHLSSCPMQCLYFSGGLCLILQMDDFRDGYVRIEVQDSAETVNGLLDYDFMLDMGENQTEDEFESKDTIAMKQFEPDMDIETVLSDEEVMLIVDQYPRYSNCPVRRAVIYSDEERYFLSVCGNGERETEMFRNESFSNLFVGD